MEQVNTEKEKRKKNRFPIERELRYKMAERGVVIATGSGKTLNMSSGGIAFTAEQQLKLPEELEAHSRSPAASQWLTGVRLRSA